MLEAATMREDGSVAKAREARSDGSVSIVSDGETKELEALKLRYARLLSAARQLEEQWEKEADHCARSKDVRDDPYDDRGFELQTRAKAFRETAKALSALLEIESSQRTEETQS
jgi:hypothetical protein